MRRALTTTALAVAALTAAAPASAAVPASVRLVECSVEASAAAFQARMTLVEGASRMALRFTLLEETAPDRVAPVRAPGLGRGYWSKPGVRAFRYKQGYRALLENASYRVRVSFRWYSEAGEAVARARRVSAPCRQFVELPNLVAEFRKFSETAPGVWRYEGVVRNTGKGAATDVPVRFTVDGNVVDTLRIASLAPGESRSLAVRGPQCSRRATLEVDPDKAIIETTDEDNLSEWRCAGLMLAG